MTDRKQPLGIDVLTAARQRIAWIFDRVPRIYVSFSGGKDSTVMTHLVMEEAIRRNRKVGLLFIDLEAQYTATIEHVREMYEMYADHIVPLWVSLPLVLRNAVSIFQPRWYCWETGKEWEWVRWPPSIAITDQGHFPFYRYGMEFEEFVEGFGHWYGQGDVTACFVGIRADESLNRFRTVANTTRKSTFLGRPWTTWKSGAVYNAYPLYDWRAQDIWTYHAKTGKPYNRLYDLMHQAGLTVHQMRICQPYGDDQRKGLNLYHVIEPDTWGRVVARVAGANSGALYAQETGNILGRLKVEKPDTMATWEEYAEFLLSSMPAKQADHYRDKIATFRAWWRNQRGHEMLDEAPSDVEAARKAPTWRRVCKVLLKHDYWCKGLSFSQTKSEAYERYKRIMKQRRQRWGFYA